MFCTTSSGHGFLTSDCNVGKQATMTARPISSIPQYIIRDVRTTIGQLSLQIRKHMALQSGSSITKGSVIHLSRGRNLKRWNLHANTASLIDDMSRIICMREATIALPKYQYPWLVVFVLKRQLTLFPEEKCQQLWASYVLAFAVSRSAITVSDVRRQSRPQ